MYLKLLWMQYYLINYRIPTFTDLHLESPRGKESRVGRCETKRKLTMSGRDEEAIKRSYSLVELKEYDGGNVDYTGSKLQSIQCH